MNDYSERIDKFLREQMTPEENEMFLEDLQKDAELRKEAQLTALMIKELQERQAREDAEIIEEVLACKAKAAQKAKIVRMVRWVGAIAAMFILFFGSVRFYQITQMDNLFGEYYKPYKVNVVGEPRGNTDEATKKELAALFNQVGTEKDVASTIQKLQTIFESINSESGYEYSLYADDIAWYLALAYLKDHQKDKAIELLKVIVKNDSESEFGKKAQIMLDELE